MLDILQKQTKMKLLCQTTTSIIDLFFMHIAVVSLLQVTVAYTTLSCFVQGFPMSNALDNLVDAATLTAIAGFKRVVQQLY